MAYASNEDLFPVWREPRSIWERTGLNREQQRRLNLAMVAVTTQPYYRHGPRADDPHAR